MDYLNTYGILTCNVNPYLPSLSDIDCTWADMTDLIDSHQLFFCKVYRGRSTYLSREVYYLLKHCRKYKPLTPQSQCLYNLLLNNPPTEIKTLKSFSSLSLKEFNKEFDYLLRNLYITAIQNGKYLNDNWSTFLYGTSDKWEESTANIPNKNKTDIELSKEQLWNILHKSMSINEFNKLII